MFISTYLSVLVLLKRVGVCASLDRATATSIDNEDYLDMLVRRKTKVSVEQSPAPASKRERESGEEEEEEEGEEEREGEKE